MPIGRSRVAALALVAAATLCVYGPVCSSLARQWAGDENYSHGFVIVPCAAWFVWRDRRALAALPLRPSAWGLIVALGALAVYVAGQLGAELFLSRVSLVGLLAGAIVFLFSAAHLRRLAFPLALLILTIPLPAIVFNRIAFPLQLLASRAGEAVLSGAGVPVLREGNILELPHITLEVAQACSGIRSLVSLVALAVVFGKVSGLPRGPRIALALCAVPIAIVANAARVAGTGLAAHWIGAQAAQGFFHEFSGWVMFLVACAGLLLVERALAALPRVWPPQRPGLVLS
jgi:exosortase